MAEDENVTNNRHDSREEIQKFVDVFGAEKEYYDKFYGIVDDTVTTARLKTNPDIGIYKPLVEWATPALNKMDPFFKEIDPFIKKVEPITEKLRPVSSVLGHVFKFGSAIKDIYTIADTVTRSNEGDEAEQSHRKNEAIKAGVDLALIWAPAPLSFLVNEVVDYALTPEESDIGWIKNKIHNIFTVPKAEAAEAGGTPGFIDPVMSPNYGDVSAPVADFADPLMPPNYGDTSVPVAEAAEVVSSNMPQELLPTAMLPTEAFNQASDAMFDGMTNDEPVNMGELLSPYYSSLEQALADEEALRSLAISGNENNYTSDQQVNQNVDVNVTLNSQASARGMLDELIGILTVKLGNVFDNMAYGYI